MLDVVVADDIPTTSKVGRLSVCCPPDSALINALRETPQHCSAVKTVLLYRDFGDE